MIRSYGPHAMGKTGHHTGSNTYNNENHPILQSPNQLEKSVHRIQPSYNFNEPYDSWIYVTRSSFVDEIMHIATIRRCNDAGKFKAV